MTASHDQFNISNHNGLAGREPRPAASGQPSRPFMRRPGASRYLLEVWGITRAPATLAKLACVGGGPQFHHVGRVPYYGPDHLDEYAIKLLGAPVGTTSAVPKG